MIPFLTEGESRVFEALVELGESSIGNILKQSGVSHSKIYDILKRLQKKGMASAVIRNGRQFFSSAEPSRLFELAEEAQKEVEKQKKQLESDVIHLTLKKQSAPKKSILSSYEGMKGMKTVLELLLGSLGKGEEVLILGSPKAFVENVGGYLRDWQKKRIAKGAVCRIITDADAPSWEKEPFWKKSIKQRLTFTKRGTSTSPAHMVITDKAVATIYFAEAILSVIIEHAEIAKRYKAFFDQLWNAG